MNVQIREEGAAEFGEIERLTETAFQDYPCSSHSKKQLMNEPC